MALPARQFQFSDRIRLYYSRLTTISQSGVPVADALAAMGQFTLAALDVQNQIVCERARVVFNIAGYVQFTYIDGANYQEMRWPVNNNNAVLVFNPLDDAWMPGERYYQPGIEYEYKPVSGAFAGLQFDSDQIYFSYDFINRVQNFTYTTVDISRNVYLNTIVDLYK